MKSCYRCPICEGNGLVPGGYYMRVHGVAWSSITTVETCRACDGTGIIWDPQPDLLSHELDPEED